MRKSLLFIPVLLFPPLASSCSFNQNNITFVLSNKGYIGSEKEFVENIENQANLLIKTEDKYKELDPINIDYKISSDDKTKEALLANGSADFGFLKIKTVIDNNLYKDNYYPIIQTRTNPFVFDKDMEQRYLDGSENDPLIKIAKEAQEKSFGKKPFSEWEDKEFGWNGYRYESFYDTDSTTAGYRGMILICGNEDKIKKIRESWNKKDWETFRNYGIIHGDINSIGNFKLQEKLLQKHFGKPELSLLEDKREHDGKYDFDKYGTEKLGDVEGFSIGFTDEGSFAWTNSKLNSGSFRTSQKDEKIEILSVTDPSIYDVGVFNKRKLNDLKIELISKSILKIVELDQNNYGAGLGYNGYSLIKDFQSEVLEKYNETFGNQ